MTKPRFPVTFTQDMINAATPLLEQFPEDYGDNAETFPGPLDFGYRVVVCSRSKYRALSEAQRYFAELQVRQGWTHESAIFRTKRFWAKRVFP